MADKDPKDEELNQEGQEDINNDDDSFGLPDLDYQPLEETPEEEEVEVEAEVEVEETADEFGDVHTDELAADFEEEVAEEPVRKYSAYRDEESKNNAPMIIVGIVAIILIAAGIWYFGFYRPAALERAQIEQVAAEQAAAERQAELDAQRAAEAAAAAEEAEAEADEAQTEDDTPTSRGTITTISEPTQRYYVIVGSFIDIDLATDLGKKLAGKGVNTSLIAPSSQRRLSRLALADYGTYNEAASAAADLKADYGENLWVLKY